MSDSTTTLLGWAGIALIGAGIAGALLFQVGAAASPVRTLWTRYESALDRELRFLLVRQSGARVARWQLAVVAALAVLAFLLESFVLLLLLPLAAAAPWVHLRRKHEERVAQIEQLLDSWLLMLANALKGVPAIAEAMAASGRLMRPPISEEIELTLKEVHLGTPLDEAVLAMSRRIDSRVVSSALATLLIARQTGGDLPKLLENAAATLREMARLEGVVRTKTAEGRSQAWVLGAIPFFLIGAIYKIDSSWLVPLTTTGLGYALIAGASVLWVVAILAARKILAVDI